MLYAVRGGPHPGIYTTWDEASKHSSGQPGALCKKFQDRQSAEEFVGPLLAGKPPRPRGKSEPHAPPARPGAEAGRGTHIGPPTAAELPRTYLEVPFSQKDEAKALGAKWDGHRKKWFAGLGSDVAKFSRWLPGAEAPAEGRQAVSAAPAAPSATRPQRATSQSPRGGAQERKRPVATPFLPAAKRQEVAALETDEVALYTDGACKGNNHVALKSCPAGWGVVVVEGGVVGTGGAACRDHSSGRSVSELFGPVVLDAASPLFLGAEVGSNNTGELTAICEALLWLRDCDRSTRSAAIVYDSIYAAKITTGEFRAQKNQRLAAEARGLLREVQAKRRVRLLHVKGHSGQRWNEVADALANRGAAGQRCTQGRWVPGGGGLRGAPNARAGEPPESSGSA